MKDATGSQSPRSVVPQSPRSIKIARKPVDSAVANAEELARDREIAMYHRIMSKRLSSNSSPLLLPPPQSEFRLTMRREPPPAGDHPVDSQRLADDDTSDDFDNGVFVLDL